MGPHWLAVLGCLIVFATSGHSLVLPPKDTDAADTLVVARSEDGVTTEAADVTDPTTEEPNPPIKLTEMDVRSDVSMRYAHTAVVTRVRNPAKRAQEATFRVLLPETAFISGFTMTLDGKSYKAYVKEKEEAKQIYSQAVSQGIGAAHIASKARDSNHFTVSVNVEPNTVAVFNLTYEEMLVRRNNVYNHAINLHPGELVPKLTVTVHVKEAQKITVLRVPEVRTGNEIDATENDAQNSKATIVRGHDDREATITFQPDLDEQLRLRDIYAEKAKESQSHTNSWAYGYAQEEPEKKQEGVLGQFVVQYDVERPEHGEILVNDGYFVHFFAPSSLPPLHKHVVFVLDTSGSMMGRKIEQLRDAMQTILSELNSGDYFSIVEFSSDVQVHDLIEADQEPPKRQYYYYDYNRRAPTTLVPPSQATPENVAKANVIVSRLNASGGTNIYSALSVAVELIQRGIGWKQPVTVQTEPVVPPVDEPKIPENGEEVLNTTRAPTTTPRIVRDESKKLEPIVIFLTDGDPTVGETNPTRIINHLTEKNYGENKASIFSLAFGEDADRKFLRKLSLRNEGFMRHIYEAADAPLQLRDFYRQVSSPLLADVKFIYPPEQVKADSVTKHKFRTFYAGSETVVAGRVTDADVQLAPQVIGICGVRDDDSRKRYEMTPVVRNTEGYLPLERLWAYLTVKQLLDERDAADSDVDSNKDNENSPEKKALAIALKYEFVTPLTSLVVVKPNATNAVDAESVDKPQGGDYGNGPASFGLPLAAHSFSVLPGIAGPPGAGGFAYKAAFSPAIRLSSAIGPSSADRIVSQDYPVPEVESDYGSAGNMDAFSSTPQNSEVHSSALAQPVYRMSAYGGQKYRASYSVASLPSTAYSVAALSTRLPSNLVSGSRASPAYPTASMTRLPSNLVSDLAGPAGGQAFIISSPAPLLPSLPPQTTTIISTSTAAPVAPTAVPNVLEAYSLQSYPWVQALIVPNSDNISVKDNQTTVTLALNKADVPPKEENGDSACDKQKTTDGSDGVCVYLTRCDSARTITADQYSNSYCIVKDKYAGVCCPKDKVDIPKL